MISKSLIKLAVEKNNSDLIKVVINQELKTLRSARRRYENSIKSKNVDKEALQLSYLTKYGNIDNQIEHLTDLRKTLTKGDIPVKTVRDLVQIQKRQKLTENMSVAQLNKLQDNEKVHNTFLSMFNKGQFILSDDEMSEFDTLFNKLGLGITIFIKNKIKNNYKYWASDIAYQFINEWVNNVQSTDKSGLSDSDIKQMNKYINIVKGRLS